MSTATRTGSAAAHWLGYAACAGASCLWGTGFYFGRLALNEMSVEYMVLYRFLFALLGMLPVLLWTKERIGRDEWKTLAVSAAMGVPVQFLMQFHGLARTTVSHASLMVGTMPVLLALVAVIFAHEHMDAIGWTALAASTVGAGLVVLGGNHTAAHGGPSLVGDLMVVFSLAMALVWIMLSMKLMRRHSPPVVTAYTLLAGTAMLAVWVLGPLAVQPVIPNHAAPIPFVHVSRTAWLALAASGILCTATTTLLWNYAIHKVPASRAGVFLNIEPALGSVLGVKLLGEHLGPFAWLGGALIVGAAVVITVRGRALK